MYWLYDIAIGVILLLFALRGQKRGLVLTLCSLVAVLTAFLGANLIADALTPKVADILAPKITSIFEQRLQDNLQKNSKTDSGTTEKGTSKSTSGSAGSGTAASGSGTTASGDEEAGILSSLLDRLHLPAGMFDSAKEALDSLKGIKDLPSALSLAIARTAAETVLYLAIFLISFLLILLAWHIIGGALNLVARLPVLHFFNRTGGFVFGLCKGTFFLFIVAWVLRYLGGIIPDDAVEHTYLLHFFMTTSPFTLLLGS